MGYVTCITSVLQLQSIPLYIAGRYRDLNALWELPLAGQMLAAAQIFVLLLPAMFAPVLFYTIRSFNTNV